MPLVKISMLKGKNKEYKQSLLAGVHKALVDIFKIPDHDRMQQIYEFEKENFETNAYMSGNATIIEIVAFSGRQSETKEKLYQEIINNLSESPGIDSQDIMIILNEQPKENWAIRGGKQASKLDLGFDVNV